MSFNRKAEVRSTRSGRLRLTMRGPPWVDIVAKVPKGAAADFSSKNETSENRRSIGLRTRYQNRLCVWRLATWSPTSLFNRCTYGSENLRPMPQKDFCNTSFDADHSVFGDF